MTDYSNYKNGLDIIEALTKRLDRLTGFDEELDTILGGHIGHNGGPCDNIVLANKLSGPENVLQENPPDSCIMYNGTVEWCQHSSIVPMSSVLGVATDTYHHLVETREQQLIESVNSTHINSTFYKHQPQNWIYSEDPVKSDTLPSDVNTLSVSGNLQAQIESTIRKDLREQLYTQSSTSDNTKGGVGNQNKNKRIAALDTNGTYLMETDTPDSSVLRRFLDIPEYEPIDTSCFDEGRIRLPDIQVAPSNPEGGSISSKQTLQMTVDSNENTGLSKESLESSNHTDEIFDSSTNHKVLQTSDLKNETSETSNCVTSAFSTYPDNGNTKRTYIIQDKTYLDQVVYKNWGQVTSTFQNALSENGVMIENDVCTLVKESFTNDKRETLSDVSNHCSTAKATKNSLENGDIHRPFVLDFEKEFSNAPENVEYRKLFEDNKTATGDGQQSYNECKDKMATRQVESFDRQPASAEKHSALEIQTSTQTLDLSDSNNSKVKYFTEDTEKDIETEVRAMNEFHTGMVAGTDQEEYFTASECSGATTPQSFQSAGDRDSIVSPIQRLVDANLFLVPVKDLSEYLSNKSSSMLNEYHDRFQSFVNENTKSALSEDFALSFAQRPESRRDTSSPYKYYEEFPMGEKDVSFTTMEEVKQKHTMRLSPLHGYTMSREDVSSSNLFKTSTTKNDDLLDISNMKMDIAKSTMPTQIEVSRDGVILQDRDVTSTQTKMLKEIIGTREYEAEAPNSFTTIEEVQDIQHIKLSPLEGCSLDSQVITQEFSPRDYLSLSMSRQDATLSSPEMMTLTSPGTDHNTALQIYEEHNERTKEMRTHEAHMENRTKLEKYKGWYADEMAIYNETKPPNSFTTIEEVRDIQHIKLSPLEGCSLDSQVITQEFSPRDYLSLSMSRQDATLSSQEMIPLTSPGTDHNTALQIYEEHNERTKEMQTHEAHMENRTKLEKYKGWDTDEMAIYNETKPSNSFTTIEEVQDIQHIKLSPLEGCSLDSQVISQEFSPRDYLSLSMSRQDATLSSPEMMPLTSSGSDHNTALSSLKQNSKLETYEAIESTKNKIEAPKFELVAVNGRDLEERFTGWNRNEMVTYNEEQQPPNSFTTVEEVRDIQHIKLSPLEGCSLDSQVITQEFSPRDYLMLNMGGLPKRNEIESGHSEL